MCGIVGLYRKSGITKEDTDKFTKMLEDCEKRGKDASGIFNSKMLYIKIQKKSSEFVNTDECKEYIEQSIGLKYIIGHCRQATRGDPSDNANNHPVFTSDEKIFLVHNGTIDCPHYDKTPTATDTMVFIHAIEEIQKSIKASATLEEVVTRAFCDADMKAKSNSSVIVVGNMKNIVITKTKGKPIVLQNQGDRIIFASETEIAKFDPLPPENKKIGHELRDYAYVIIDVEKGNLKSGFLPINPESSPLKEVEETQSTYTYGKKWHGTSYGQWDVSWANRREWDKKDRKDIVIASNAIPQKENIVKETISGVEFDELGNIDFKNLSKKKRKKLMKLKEKLEHQKKEEEKKEKENKSIVEIQIEEQIKKEIEEDVRQFNKIEKKITAISPKLKEDDEEEFIFQTEEPVASCLCIKCQFCTQIVKTKDGVFILHCDRKGRMVSPVSMSIGCEDAFFEENDINDTP